MRRAKPLPIVTMKIFVEKDIILEMRIGLQFLSSSIDRPLPVFIPQKDPGKALRKLHTDLIQRIELPGMRRILDLEIIPIIVVEPL